MRSDHTAAWGIGPQRSSSVTGSPGSHRQADANISTGPDYWGHVSSCLYQDKGFQGFFQTGITILQPKKTPRGGELTPPEQATNRRIPSIRIRIEDAIGGVKRDRIVKDKIRLLKDGIRDAVMETCCGLHNFRLQYRPWHYAS